METTSVITLFLFSDEKNFSQDQKVNTQNHRWLASDPNEVPVVSRTKFPVHVMVLGVVSSDGDVMPPHVFEQGLKINAEVYVHVLDTVVKPWMERVARGRKYVFQQDGAPAHTSKSAQEYCARSFPAFITKDMWPPSSPDLNPLDFFVWSALEELVNKSPHNNRTSLIAAIERGFQDLSRVHVQRACASFRPRPEKCVAAEGGFLNSYLAIDTINHP